MARHVALAVDLGASGGRVVAGGFDGRLLELEEVHRFDNGPVTMAGRLIWDLPRLWQEVSLGLRAAAARGAWALATDGATTVWKRTPQASGVRRAEKRMGRRLAGVEEGPSKLSPAHAFRSGLSA